MLNLEQQLIIERYKNPLFGGDVNLPTHTSRGENTSCGDEITWNVSVSEGIITEIRHQCRACAICTASADFLAEKLQGKPVADLATTSGEEHAASLGIPLSPIRKKCSLLPLETLKNLTPNL